MLINLRRDPRLGHYSMMVGTLMLLFIGFNRIWHFVYIRLGAMLCRLFNVTRLLAASTFWRYRNILSYQLIQFNGYYARKKCPHLLRMVVVWDEQKNRRIVLLTNHLDFGATTISAIYKDRWQIELFFKALKQNLKVKTFVGTSENALYIQIWTALIAMLLIKYLQFKSKFVWSLCNLVALIRWNLFTYRDLWEWIDKPFDVLPLTPDSVQYLLHLLRLRVLNSKLIQTH